MWMHSSGRTVFIDSPDLAYHPSTFRTWINESERRRCDAEDHWFYAYRPREGDLIVEVGAGKGEDTVTFSQYAGASGRVIAVEAHPITYRCLRMFCELNRLQNVTSLNYAVAGKPGPVTIGSMEGWQANRIGDPGTNALAVEGITLDEIVASERLERIDFLKMNIEGAEAAAIKGMSKTLKITRAVCIACHDFRALAGDGDDFRTKRLIQESIKAAGFEIISRDSDPRPYISDQVNAIRVS
jgi:FkbM family methyltransferase